MNHFLIVLVVSAVTVAVVCGIVYSFFLAPLVRRHFGEESRRDYDAIRRRREFERRCGKCFGAFSFSVLAGVGHQTLSMLAPEAAVWIRIVQVGAIVVAALFAWAAAARWQEPLDN